MPPGALATRTQVLQAQHLHREARKETLPLLAAAGMHFMDRYNYDVERIRRCVIQYSTPDGVYPFCTVNGGPTYRPFIERMIAQRQADRRETRVECPSPDGDGNGLPS